MMRSIYIAGLIIELDKGSSDDKNVDDGFSCGSEKIIKVLVRKEMVRKG